MLANMNMCIDENSTRNMIVLHLKKNGGMSIDELSKVIDITPMGIRQHLIALEKKGLVTYVPKRRGIGRPGFVYMLTDAADGLFPSSYDEFALGLLREIRDHEGAEKIDRIFGWRREQLFRDYSAALANKDDLGDLLPSLKGLLESKGYFVEVLTSGNQCRLKQYHCPVNRIAAEFRDVCRHELQLYRELINRNVTREQSMTEGASSCIYIIPAN